eukprot:augustus_masked-scaffold_31-processed-gene-3.70-mRNA-1 protein AED:1.00 eAED:1.00 QI:0/-1/0/0/-1/1/1/0/609
MKFADNSFRDYFASKKSTLRPEENFDKDIDILLESLAEEAENQLEELKERAIDDYLKEDLRRQAKELFDTSIEDMISEEINKGKVEKAIEEEKKRRGLYHKLFQPAVVVSKSETFEMAIKGKKKVTILAGETLFSGKAIIPNTRLSLGGVKQLISDTIRLQETRAVLPRVEISATATEKETFLQFLFQVEKFGDEVKNILTNDKLIAHFEEVQNLGQTWWIKHATAKNSFFKIRVLTESPLHSTHLLAYSKLYDQYEFSFLYFEQNFYVSIRNIFNLGKDFLNSWHRFPQLNLETRSYDISHVLDIKETSIIVNKLELLQILNEKEAHSWHTHHRVVKSILPRNWPKFTSQCIDLQKEFIIALIEKWCPCTKLTLCYCSLSKFAAKYKGNFLLSTGSKGCFKRIVFNDITGVAPEVNLVHTVETIIKAEDLNTSTSELLRKHSYQKVYMLIHQLTATTLELLSRSESSLENIVRLNQTRVSNRNFLLDSDRFYFEISLVKPFPDEVVCLWNVLHDSVRYNFSWKRFKVVITTEDCHSSEQSLVYLTLPYAAVRKKREYELCSVSNYMIKRLSIVEREEDIQKTREAEQSLLLAHNLISNCLQICLAYKT